LIKVLVVDDESTTRKGLIKHIPWNELGVNIVHEAKDGIDALVIADTIHPDIVLSDIKMPGINGIELALRLREQFPRCKIIFLSGYSDKEYLKEAIKLGAVSYIEKPINLSEVKEAVKKAVTLCIQDEEKIFAEENINTVLLQNLPFIKQKIINDLIIEKSNIEENIKELNLINIPFTTKDWFNVMLIKLSMEKEQTIDENQTSISKVVKIVDKCSCDITHISANKTNDHIIVILSCNMGNNENRISKMFELIQDGIEENKMIGINLFCAIGKVVHGMKQIPQSYVTALLTMKKLFFYGYNNLIFYKDNRGEGEPFSFEESIHAKFTEYLSDKNQQEAVTLIDGFCKGIQKHDTAHVNDVKNIFFKLAFQLLMETEKRGINFSGERENEGKYLWNLISSFETLQELNEYLVGKITIVFKRIEELESSSRTVFKVKNYIEKNYHDDNLSTRTLATQVYLTPTYLSSLFKKETSKTISEYIIEVRIEKSKEYLMDCKLKLFEVAKNVGYNDANYYAKAFKKQIGLNPSKYREKYLS